MTQFKKNVKIGFYLFRKENFVKVLENLDHIVGGKVTIGQNIYGDTLVTIDSVFDTFEFSAENRGPKGEFTSTSYTGPYTGCKYYSGEGVNVYGVYHDWNVSVYTQDAFTTTYVISRI